MVASLEGLNREVTTGGVYRYVVKRSGKLEEIEVDRDDLIIPDEEQYRSLEFYGIATETYPVTFEGETTQKISVLIRIIDTNDPQNKGVFKSSVTFESAGPKSTIGQIFAAIRGEPFVGQIDNDFWGEVLGGRFAASLNLKVKADATYVNLIHGSIKPSKQRATTAKATPVADPFGDDTEEDE